MSNAESHPAGIRALENHIWYPQTYSTRLPGAVFRKGKHAAMEWAGAGGIADVFVPPLPDDAGEDTVAAARAEVLELIDAAADAAPGASIGCRAATAPAPRWLTATAMARGMQWGWTSRWMVRDLVPADGEGTQQPEGIDIRELDQAPQHTDQIPCIDEKWDAIVSHATGRQPDAAPDTGEIVVLGAFSDDALVGAVTLHVNGHDASSGLWDLGVTPDYQRRGIGRALVSAALGAAQRRGAKEVTLNSTDEGVKTYLACGFTEVGRGQTWWFTPDHPASCAPTPAQIALTTAIVEDDAEAITAMSSVSPDTLPCGLTPLRLAARTASPAAARSLIARGLALDVLSAWELGWKDEARDAATAAPPERGIDAIDPEHHATPLHVAVRDDDEDLARLLLDAGADLNAKDDMFGSNPARWAVVLNKPNMTTLLAEAAAQRQHATKSS